MVKMWVDNDTVAGGTRRLERPRSGLGKGQDGARIWTVVIDFEHGSEN